MDRESVMAIAFLITSALKTGLTIQQVFAEVEATGIVPQEKWDAFKAEWDDAENFWSS